MINYIEADVLIIGGGAAACLAALESAKFNTKVIIVDKGRLGRSGSTPGSGGTGHARLAANIGKAFFKDSVEGGSELNNRELLQIFIEENDLCAELLEDLGLPTSKADDGSYKMVKGFGETEFRPGLTVKDKGYGLMEFLRKEVLHRNVQLLENIMMIKIFTFDNQVLGALGVNRSNGELYAIKASSVVVAAGGATGLFPYPSANFKTTGDAYSLLYNAGAKLANMEFQEFTIVPLINGLPLASGGINWCTQYGMFLNSHEERFMLKYAPELKEKAPRGVLARAIYTEIEEGRGPALIDLTHVSEDIWEQREKEEAKTHLLWKLKRLGVNYRSERFSWVPTIHTSLGGAIINKNAETSVNGLYAAGESAGHGGIFGADRVGKAISACYVFGRLAGFNAALRSLNMKQKTSFSTKDVENYSKQVLAQLEPSSNNRKKIMIEQRKNLLDLCWKNIGLKREKESLLDFLALIEKLDTNYYSGHSSNDITDTLELKNLILTAKLIARAALERTESRGQHYRIDYPLTDQKWEKIIVQEKGQKGDNVISIENIN